MKTPIRVAAKTSLDELRSLCRRGELSAAAAKLDAQFLRQAPPAEAVALRARIALRLRKAADALEIVARYADTLGGSAERGQAALLHGIAYARLGDDKAANAQFKRVESAAKDDVALQAALLYERAAAAWIARDLGGADAFLDALEALEPPADLRVEARVVRGAVAASRENLPAQGAILLDALRLVRAQREPAVLAWAVIASQIAYLAREMRSPALRDAAFAQLAAIPWTQDLAEYRFTMLHAIGWRHALDGDFFNAFRRLKDARAFAPTDGWRVTSSCDRAYLATVLGERRWAEQELSDAHELAANVSWTSLDGEERFALLELAELFASRDPALALSYVARYKEAGSRFSRDLASSDDRRVHAMESFSFGVVQNALGQRDEAIRLIGEAWTIYDRIGYDWRAGRAALLLAELTRDASWKDRAANKLRGYERSWLRAEASPAALRVPPEAAALTPARRGVYEAILRGLTTAQIAAEQGRSEFTVRNHVKAIFKAFGVTSRPALIARAIGTAGARE